MITFLRDLIAKDFWLKLFSLVLAILIWFTVNIAVQSELPLSTALAQLNTRERVFENLPVTILSSAGDVRAFKVQPGQVAVTLQGEPRVLRQIKPGDIHPMVDLTGIEAARELWKRIEVSTPAGVIRVRVEPEQVLVVFPGNK